MPDKSPDKIKDKRIRTGAAADPADRAAVSPATAAEALQETEGAVRVNRLFPDPFR